jgi:predicted nucleotidyltransferase
MAQISPPIKNAITQFLRNIIEENIEIKEAFLFGSYAKNTENIWSDIDIAIISPAFSENRFEERIRLMKISSRVDSRIEPVPFSPESFTDEDPLAYEIKKNGIPLPLQ